MNEDLLVLLVPAIDAVPVERDEILERRHLVVWVGIAPYRVLRHLVADPDRPVRRFPLIGAEGVMVGRDQLLLARLCWGMSLASARDEATGHCRYRPA